MSPSASGGTGGGTTRSGGRFTACAGNAECDTAHGFGCVLGECRHACRSHFDCAGTGPCATLPGNARALGGFCAPASEPPLVGGYYSSCPSSDECAEDAGFVCLGAGEGDLDSYCTNTCAVDSDCPRGFQCDDVRVGTDTTASYCVRKGFCATCETDEDCLAIPDQVCARDQAGDKICTKRCDAGVDSCPWGNAAACATWDSELGVPTCAHRFGSCRGEGKGCEPCISSDDCPNGVCNRSDYTGERWCVDLSVECSCDGLSSTQGVCSGANGCPRSPGDLPMLCYDDPRDQTSLAAQHCFAADSVATPFGSPQSGCWRR